MSAVSPVASNEGFVYSSVVDAPRDEVFAWYAGPDAFLRLWPPWLRVITEADSLQNGRRSLRCPGGYAEQPSTRATTTHYLERHAGLRRSS